MASAKAYDPVIQAGAGTVAAQARPSRQGGSSTHLVNSILMDKTTAMTAAQAVLAALFARARGKGGQHIELSMLNAGLAFNWCDVFADRVFVDQDPERFRRRALIPEVFGTAETADAKHVTVVTGSLSAFARAFDREELLDDPALRDPEGAFDALAVRAAMSAEYRKHTLAQIMAKWAAFDMPGVEVPTTVDRVLAGAQVRHNEAVEVHDDQRFGRIRFARPAANMSGTPQRIQRPAPVHAEHSVEVLGELGYTGAQIEQWSRDGVIDVTAPSKL